MNRRCLTWEAGDIGMITVTRSSSSCFLTTHDPVHCPFSRPSVTLLSRNQEETGAASRCPLTVAYVHQQLWQHA